MVSCSMSNTENKINLKKILTSLRTVIFLDHISVMFAMFVKSQNTENKIKQNVAPRSARRFCLDYI